MMLNYIWISFFLLALVIAIVRLLFFGDIEVFNNISKTMFESAGSSFELALGLTGVLTLWMGILKVGERAGLIDKLARLTAPFFAVLFPTLPKGHPAFGTMVMNFSANLLGIDNAATPLGLETMQLLQKENKSPGKARITDPMIMFLCINASGLTLIPITVLLFRSQLGAANPTDVFIPIFLATACSTLFAILAVGYKQRISLLHSAFLIPILLFSALLVLLFFLLLQMDESKVSFVSSLIANSLILSVIVLFLVYALFKKIDVFSVFIEGAKGGFKTAVTIIPYLVAILVGVSVFRASGGMELITQGLSSLMQLLHLPDNWVGALPTMLMKPLSGSGARGLMIDAMEHWGPDSFVGHVVCVCQGASDTTLYIIALYAGSVAIKHTRYTLGICLLSDLIGLFAALIFSYLFFG